MVWLSSLSTRCDVQLGCYKDDIFAPLSDLSTGVSGILIELCPGIAGKCEARLQLSRPRVAVAGAAKRHIPRALPGRNCSEERRISIGGNKDPEGCQSNHTARRGHGYLRALWSGEDHHPESFSCFHSLHQRVDYCRWH